jgi:predicted HicB family RNase H-like nuclease
MEYKGYNAVVTYDNDLGILHGEVIDTRDVITFQGRSVDDLQEAFQQSVDDYLKFCKERGREPDKPFSGKVALRMDPETHRTIVGAARTSGKSLNTWILDAIGNELERADEQVHVDIPPPWGAAVGPVQALLEHLREAWQQHGQQGPVSPVMPMWVDFNRGSVWSSGAFAPIEIVRLDGSQPEATSDEYRLV